MRRSPVHLAACLAIATAASPAIAQTQPAAAPAAPAKQYGAASFLQQPLVSHLYTADPSAHVFDGKLYVYPSHDIKTDAPDDRMGGRFDMKDYHVLSMDRIGGLVTDHGVALDIADIPWAKRQMWAPDAAHKNGKYYLYFPVKDQQDIFRIGVAVSDSPAGPFTPPSAPMAGIYSIDPAVFQDGKDYYIYVGGLRGGQLQRWRTGEYRAEDTFPAANEPALSPKMARLADDMVSLAEPLRDVAIQDENGKPLTNGDLPRRFFEASWVHKYQGKYYFSYSTGETRSIVYATGDSPYGPFTFRGKILEPVLGWTNHHSIVEFKGKWYLFYHDSQMSEGITYLRNVKVTELRHRPDGSIETIDAFVE